jgi:hypothetical protein
MTNGSDRRQVIRMVRTSCGVGWLVLALGAAGTSPVGAAAVDPGGPTYHRDIVPILQRSCQRCHRPDSVAPMALLTYEQVRPYAKSILKRTHMGPVAGVMPPWYIEKDLGIQHYQYDPSLSDAELAAIRAWVEAGAPPGNPSDAPPAIDWASSEGWTIGEPDLIVRTQDIFMKGDAPDWWGEIPSVPTGLTEDRYVAALEIREVNDVLENGKPSGRETVGGRFVVHHMIWRTVTPTELGAGDKGESFESILGESWPVHEVGRNADTFDPDGARLLKAGSIVFSDSVHLHSNGRDTRARLEIGWKFHPRDYKPKYRQAVRSFGNAVDIDLPAMEANQQLHAYLVLPQHTKITTFEPHLHAPGYRMCLEAIWGIHIETLTCAGYDHNWVRGYEYAENHEPLLPKGTILHIVATMNNSPSNANVPDPRNWQGSGNRSVSNMFIDLGHGVALDEEQFQAEMAKRRDALEVTKNDHILGCPLCMVFDDPPPAANAATGSP